VKQHELCEIISNTQVASGVFDMRLKTNIRAKAGQFVNIHPGVDSLILPRPISVCEVVDGGLRMVYRVEGKGTAMFSTLKEGSKVAVTGALGNGFNMDDFAGKPSVAVIGGGIGIPPLLELSKQIKQANPETMVHAFMGFRSKDLIVEDLVDDFAKYCKIHIATDDGSFDYHGNAVEDFIAAGVKADVVAACGPYPMLRAVAKYGDDTGLRTIVSVEERMACGIGACVGCAIKIHTQGDFTYKKVCYDGPVFDSAEVVWE